jgi:glyoxylase-like metal-dependent hydrolase (beta-lactamase superfamily II)
MALAGAAIATPRTSWAASTLQLGATRIDTLSDGNLVLPVSATLGPTPAADAAPVLARYGITDGPLTPPCNVTLLRDGTNTVLFDVGAGPDFMPSAGKLADAFAALDLSPDDITHVVFTHAHPDHIWGLLDDFDDPMFPQATHMIGKTEFDYWMNPATVDSIDAGRTTFAVGARRRLEAIEDMLTTFTDGQEILPGIAARASFGHTPGHMSFDLRGGSEHAILTGDAIINHHLAFERPDWRTGSDQDPDLGATTRTRLLDQIASDQMRLIGFHLAEGGIGHAERHGEGYRFIPEDT